MTPIMTHVKTVAALRKGSFHGTYHRHLARFTDAYPNLREMFGEAGLSSETAPKRGRALPDIVPMAGGLTPVLSPALFSTQLRVPSKSSEIPNQAVFPLVTLFVLQNKYCRVFLFPHFGIQTVTQFQIRNTLSTAEGSLPTAVFGGSRVLPAYRLYPA